MVQSIDPLRQQAIQKAQRTWPFWFHFGFAGLFWSAALLVSVGIARAGIPYSNLNFVTALVAVYLVFGLMLFWATVGETVSIRLGAESCTVRKRWQRAVDQPYQSVTGHNLRTTADRYISWTELTVYLTDDWFALRSVDFPNFDELVTHFASVSPEVPYRPVLSPTEQRLARWFLISALVIGLVPVWFGFAAHQPVDRQPARLVSLVGYVFDIRQTTNRSNAFMGYDLALVNYPDFIFHVRKNSFNDSLGTLPGWFAKSGIITLLVREHDFVTKISRRQPLTFGDKYDGYRSIAVYGIGDQAGIRLRANQPAYDDSHTKPYIRLAAFLLYAIVLWSCWLAVDKQTI